jgi:tripartite-type tricarboxylate transporter receptor subunit TctC
MVALAVTGYPQSADAQQPWPTRPLRFIVPYAAGGPVDVVGRAIAEELTRSLGQPVVVDNVAGAAGKIGMEQASRARDGHTLVLNNTTASVIAELVDGRSGFDLQRDLRAVIAVMKIPLFLVANASVPASTAAELVRYAKAHPDALNYASYGAGSPQHVLTELLVRQTGMQAVHVPYKGDAPAYQAIMRNDVQFMFRFATDATAKEPRLRILGVAAPERAPVLPHIPTLKEQGIGHVDLQPLNGIFMPSGTPAAHVTRLNQAIDQSLQTATVRGRLDALGYTPVGGTAELLQTRVQADSELLRDMVARGRLQLQ